MKAAWKNGCCSGEKKSRTKPINVFHTAMIKVNKVIYTVGAST